MTVEIQRVLVLSTAHLPHEAAQAMDAFEGLRDDDSYPDGPTLEQADMLAYVSFDRVRYGYMVWVGESADACDNISDWPPAILAAARVAWDNNCTFIRFGYDGLEVDGLGGWDW